MAGAADGEPYKKLEGAVRKLIKDSADAPPPNEVLEAVGVKYIGKGETHFYVWPENMSTVEVFSAMGSQWNVDFHGNRLSLRYEALPVTMACCGIKKSQRRDVFQGVRIMERAALELFRKGC